MEGKPYLSRSIDSSSTVTDGRQNTRYPEEEEEVDNLLRVDGHSYCFCFCSLRLIILKEFCCLGKSKILILFVLLKLYIIVIVWLTWY